MLSNDIYLIVYNFNKTEENLINPKLAHYVFKYNNFKEKINLNSLKIDNPNIEVTNTTSGDYKTTYNLKFDPVLKSNSENEAVSYYVKGIYNDSFIKGEDVYSIAISESDGVYLQSYNTTPINGKIELKLENVEKNLSYIKVIAKITQNAVNEYLLYNTYIVNKDQFPPSQDNNIPYNENDKNKKDQSNNSPNLFSGSILKIILIIVGSIILLIIIILLIVVCAFNHKNKNLLDKVRGISFSEQDRNENFLTPENEN